MPYLNLDYSNKARAAITKAQEKAIAAMYKKVAKDLEKEAMKFGDFGLKSSSATSMLRSMQLNDLRKSLYQEMANLGGDIEQLCYYNSKLIGSAVIQDAYGFAKGVGMKVSGAYGYVPTAIVHNIKTGNIYNQKWYLSEAIWGDVKAKQNDINYIISKGLAMNKGSYEIAKDLEMYVDPSAAKSWDWSKVYPECSKQIDYNAQRLARTLTNHAYQQSIVMTTKDNPFCKGIKWLASNSERTCELCHERHGKIYKPDELPADHPNGLCTYVPVIEDDMSKIADRIGDWYNGNPDPALDKYAASLQGNYAKQAGADIIKTGKGQTTAQAQKAAVQKTTAKAQKQAAEVVQKPREFSRQAYDDMLEKQGKLPKTDYDGYKYSTKYLDNFKKWSGQLTDVESNGINTYTGGAYSSMNEYLRGAKSSCLYKEQMNGAKAALNKSVLTEDIMVRRGSDFISLAGLDGKVSVNAKDYLVANYKDMVGRTVVDKGFMSTTPMPDAGFGAHGVEYRILMTKGTKAQFIAPISNFKNEQEILAQAGTRFIVRDIVYDASSYTQKTFTVYMESLPEVLP